MNTWAFTHIPCMESAGDVIGGDLEADLEFLMRAALKIETIREDLGKVGPVMFKTFPLAEAAAAHRLMESSAHIGKIVLTTGTA